MRPRHRQSIRNLQSAIAIRILSSHAISQPQPPMRPGRPLLKWAGGKRQLLPLFRRFYPREFGAYFEPFVGSGAVFFDLHAAKRLDGRRVVLTDSNDDLVGCYRAVRDDPAGVVAALEPLAVGHDKGGPDHYYAVRESFNRLRRELPSRACVHAGTGGHVDLSESYRVQRPLPAER